jgi:hypothetical protein
VLAKKPIKPTEFTASRQGGTVSYTIGGYYDAGTSFDISISPILNPTLSVTNVKSYFGPTVWKSISETTFTIKKDDLESYFNGIILGYSKYKSVVLVQVRSKNNLGSSDWSGGVYSYASDFGIVESTTITCVRGKLTKKVTAVNPKCPAGYKVKK